MSVNDGASPHLSNQHRSDAGQQPRLSGDQDSSSVAKGRHIIMTYELRLGGRTIGLYDDQEDALVRVRRMMQRDADCEPEVIDTRTGRAFEPAASLRWREELASKIGY
jgi:hypothetical protein